MFIKENEDKNWYKTKKFKLRKIPIKSIKKSQIEIK